MKTSDSEFWINCILRIVTGNVSSGSGSFSLTHPASALTGDSILTVCISLDYFPLLSPITTSHNVSSAHRISVHKLALSHVVPGPARPSKH